MIGWIIFAVILALLALILFLCVGARVEYSEEGLLVLARFGHGPVRFSWQLLPKKKKPELPEKTAARAEKKAEKARKKAEKKHRKQEKKKTVKGEEINAPEPKKQGGTVELVLQLLPIGVEALGALKRRIRIDRLTVHYIAGGTDAAQTALQYGRVSGAAGVIVALLEENFKVKRREVTTDVNFLLERSVIYLDAELSIRVYQILYLGIRYGLACLKVWRANRKKAPTVAANPEITPEEREAMRKKREAMQSKPAEPAEE